MKRRLIALLLCIAMIGSMTVYAVGNEDVVCPTCGNTNCSVVHGDTSAILLELLTINNVSDLLIEMCKEENLPALKAMPAREILVLEEHASVLYEGLEEPTEQDTADLTDILDMIYQLPNAPEMVTYNTEAPRKDVEGLVTDKKVVNYDSTTGKGTLVLEAYATGQSITTTTEKAVPTDIILVLDQSSTMDYCMCGALNAGIRHTIPGSNTTCTINTQRLSALKSAAGTFVNNVIQSAEQNAVSHRIAVVGFGTYDEDEFTYTNTEILSLEPGATSFGELKSEDYHAALQDVTVESGKEIVREAIDNLAADGKTATAKGLEMACKIFEQNSVNAGEERNRVVVLFTDGDPTDGWDNGVKKAYELKNTYGATVYSVGVVDGADPSDTVNNINKYLNYISSNFPNANSWGETYERTNNGYYLTADDADILDSIFQDISQEITQGGANIELGADAVLKDVITEQFDIQGDIKVYTANCTGKSGENFTFADRVESTTITPTFDGRTVSVSGFDYSSNWVGTSTSSSGTTYHGQKLILEIPFEVRDGFLGGNGVFTNTSASAVYPNEEATEALEEFIRPAVNVPLPTLTVDAKDFTVDSGSDVSNVELKNHVTVLVDGKPWDEYEAWQKEYLNPPSDPVIQPVSFTNLTENTTYTATATLTDKTGEGREASDTANITVRKIVGGLETDKKADFDKASGTGTLTLEAYATGEKITTEVVQSQPVDIVLVLDHSGSMRDCIVCGNGQNGTHTGHTYTSRTSVLKNVMSGFVNDLYADAEASGMDHRLAMVAFGNATMNPYENKFITPTHQYFESRSETAVFTYMNPDEPNADKYVHIHEIEYFHQKVLTTFKSSNISSKYFQHALHSLNDTPKAFYEDAIARYMSYPTSRTPGTHYNYGVIMADHILTENSTTDEDRKQVIIFFTDGEPTGKSGDDAITKAKALKNSGVTIYTVGLLNIANGEIPSDFSTIAVENQYLHALSSNYPNATSHTSPGALNTELKGKSYYLAAKDADGLSAAFKGITEEISSGGSAITLDATAVLKDVISDQFELDIDKSRDRVIKVYTAACTGKNDDGYTFAERVESDLTPTVSGNTVSVTGFDYAKNWVGEEKKNDVVIGYHGTKLILEIPIKAKDGFMGGNQVETNAPGSGVFNGDEVVEEFVSPKVDVDAKPLSIIDTEWNVYLKGDLTKEQLIDGAEVQKAIDALDPWQKEYVEFETTIVDSNGNVVTDFSDLTEDETYTVKVTTVPTGEGTAASAEARGNAEVNVFMPTITFKDSAVNAGETPNYNDNFVSLVWKHDDVESTTVKMTGTEPKLSYHYEPDAAAISNETNVKVTVTMDNDNIHDYVTFYREACTGQDWSCGFTGREVDAKDENRINFIVHVKTFDLIIQKQGADADLDAAFVFNINGEGIDMDVVIYGNGSVTIKDLPSGRYTISETAGYWRYDLAADQTIDTSVTAPVDGKLTTTFTNTHDTDKWLDAIAHATNIFGSATA